MIGGKHNLVIAILGALGLSLVLIISLKNKETTPHSQKSENAISDNSAPNQPNSAQISIDKAKGFQQSLELMLKCMNFPKQEIPDSTPPIVESVIQFLQNSMGPVAGTTDRWLEWILTTKEKKQKKYRLEITETDEGKVGKELHAFVGHINSWVPEEINEDIANNPNDQIIDDLLKEGDVSTKSKAAVSIFSDGSRLEFIEVNGELEQIEIFDEDNQFGCKDIRRPETCICN